MEMPSQNEILKEFPYWIQDLTEEFQAEKLNNVGWWTNQRILKFVDGNVTYHNLSPQNQQNAQAKQWVEISKLCNRTIQYIVQNPQHYIIQFQFKESDCKQQGVKQNSNSTKIKTWKFLIKRQQDINYIKQKSELYQNYRDLFNQYLNTAKQKLDEKEKFYQRFIEQSKQCINQINAHENQLSFGIKVKKIQYKQEEYQSFKKYKILYNIIKAVQIDKLLIIPLQIIITQQNQKYLCQLDVIGFERTENTNEFQQDLNKIKNYINQLSQEYLNLLDQFELITFKKENKIFGLFKLLEINTNLQQQQQQVLQLTDYQLNYLQQLEIYDSQQLSLEIHKNSNYIYQIGQLAKKTNNFDLRKICKVEMISRGTKSYFSESGIALNETFLKELFSGFFQSDKSKRSEQINKYHKQIKEKIKQKFNYEIDFNDHELNCVLYLNSMMNHLNFFVPLQLEKILDKFNYFNILNFDQAQLLEKQKTYEGYLNDQLSQKKQILNYKYIQNFKSENLHKDLKSCIQLSNQFLGENNSIFAMMLAELSEKKDSMFLFRALECVNKVNPTLTKKISEYKKNKPIQFFSRKKQDLNESFKCQLSEEEKQKIFMEICSMNQLPQNQIVLLTQLQNSDDELFRRSKELKEKKNYIEALKILSCVTDRSSQEILKFGFECEMKAQIITNYYFSDKLFNHYCLMNDTNEIPKEVTLQIFKKYVSRYFQTCLDSEQTEYGMIAKYYQTRMLQFKDFLNEVKYLLLNQNIETLDQYICQQFEILNECRQNVLQKNEQQFAEYINNTQKQELHHAAKLISIILN